MIRQDRRRFIEKGDWISTPNLLKISEDTRERRKLVKEPLFVKMQDTGSNLSRVETLHSRFKTTHGIHKTFEARFIEKQARLALDHRFHYTAHAVGDDQASRGLRFDGGDAEILLTGTNIGTGAA